MAFRPPFCPFQDCAEHRSQRTFRYHRRGSFRRKCDGKTVPRFSCITCGRRFSAQTFRFDYRWRIPRIHRLLFRMFVSKVTMRQMARILEVKRQTVERRLLAIGRQCEQIHHFLLDRHKERGGLKGRFQLDELETYETDRRLKPVTMPVLIERHSFFVVTGDVAPMAARGQLSKELQERKKRYESIEGVRRSGSVKAVDGCLRRLAEVHSGSLPMCFESDRKSSYRRLFREHAQGRFGYHRTESSKTIRDNKNLLFPINHTLAMMRDGISRLVRRSWGASKLRSRLLVHFWIWVAFRNYVRGITVKTRTTPAEEMGVVRRGLRVDELLFWRWPTRMAGFGQ